MQIGELASRVGISTDSIRLYERLGLVQSVRRSNGYRDYPEVALELLGYIKTAQRLGFTLAEIAGQLPEMQQVEDVELALREVFAAKAAMIQGRIDELTALRRELLERVATDCPLGSQRKR